jgi:hypothetical protein
MNLKISPAVLKKLAEKHGVSEAQIVECFANRTGKMLLDNREQHRTNPPTQWFISETDYAVKMKVVFIQHPGGQVEIKSAFPPNETELCIYTKHAC